MGVFYSKYNLKKYFFSFISLTFLLIFRVGTNFSLKNDTRNLMKLHHFINCLPFCFLYEESNQEHYFFVTRFQNR